MEFPDIKVGVHMLLKEHPCRIVEVKTSKTGKHGHMKKAVTGIGLFTDKKYTGLFTHHDHPVRVEVGRINYSGLDVTEDGFLSLMLDDSGEMREDIQLEDTEMIERIRGWTDEGLGFSVVVLVATWQTSDEPTTQEKVIEIKKEED